MFEPTKLLINSHSVSIIRKSVYEWFCNGEKIVSLVFGGTFKVSSYCSCGMWGEEVISKYFSMLIT